VPVLAVGSKDFIGQEVKRQMEHMAENVEYQELPFWPPAHRGVSAATGQGLLGLLAKVTVKHATLDEFARVCCALQDHAGCLNGHIFRAIARFLVCIRERKRPLK
jgi:hypothetical protein